MTTELITSPPPVNFPYTAIDLTDQITRLPMLYGKVNGMGLFKEDPVATKMVEIILKDGEILILDYDEKAKPTHGTDTEEGSIIVKLAEAEHYETLTADDLQDRLVRLPGGAVLSSRDMKIAEKLKAARLHFDQTKEYMRMQALKGRLVNGTGKVLYDWFEVFGMEQKVIDLKLDTDTSDVIEALIGLADHVEDSLKGDVSTGIHILVDRTFFQRFSTHPTVEKYYLGGEGGASVLQNARMNGKFTFGEGGITLEVYRGRGTNTNRQQVAFVDAGCGHAFPVGTMHTFQTHWGPPNHIDHVNTDGVEAFVSPKTLDHGKGVEFMHFSRGIHICKNPGALAKLISSN